MLKFLISLKPVQAIETIFPGRGADMVKGWAKEYMDEGRLFEAREMVIESLDINFNKNVPTDIQQKIQALNNRLLLKRLLKPAFQQALSTCPHGLSLVPSVLQ